MKKLIPTKGSTTLQSASGNRRQGLIYVVLLCQLLAGFIPLGMMPGNASDAGEPLFVFCGAQNNAALLAQAQSGWAELLEKADGNANSAEHTSNDPCPFGVLSGINLATLDTAAQQFFTEAVAVPLSYNFRFSSFPTPFLLGPNNKAPPVSLSA